MKENERSRKRDRKGKNIAREIEFCVTFHTNPNQSRSCEGFAIPGRSLKVDGA